MVYTYGRIGLIGRGCMLLRKVFLVRKGWILIGMSKGFKKTLIEFIV